MLGFANDTNNNQQLNIRDISLSDREFNLFRDLIYQKCSIVLKESKKSLLLNRLNKRLIACGCRTYKEYYD